MKSNILKVFHVGRPNIPSKEKILLKISQVLESERLTNNGSMVQELEKKVQKYLGVKHCICVCNATIGLELLQRALDLEGEVIIPSFTFIATANSLRWQRIDPVFCDVRMDNHLIDPTKIEALITPRTSAIMAVPIWGHPCDYSTLQAIADEHDLKLIFDSAHAFGCKIGDQYLGGYGEAEVFSFHATKVFSTGEGGAITTNSDKLAEKLRLMRNFGFTDYDSTEHIGTNAKMSEFSAAYGLVHLDELDSLIDQNKKIHQAYLQEFSKFNELKFLDYTFPGKSNYQYVVAHVSTAIRDSLVEYFHDQRVLVRRYFYPGCHRLEPYASNEQYQKLDLYNTDKTSSEIMVFPTGRQLNETNVKEFADLYGIFRNQNFKR